MLSHASFIHKSVTIETLAVSTFLVVKGTAHTGMKGVHVKATMITLAAFGIDETR